MKIKLLSVLLLNIFSCLLFAQEAREIHQIEHGPQLMYHFAVDDGSDEEYGSYWDQALSFGLGYEVELRIAPMITLSTRPGINYSKNQDVQVRFYALSPPADIVLLPMESLDRVGLFDYETLTIMVPVMLNFYLWKRRRFGIHVGFNSLLPLAGEGIQTFSYVAEDRSMFINRTSRTISTDNREVFKQANYEFGYIVGLSWTANKLKYGLLFHLERRWPGLASLVRASIGLSASYRFVAGKTVSEKYPDD